MPRPRGQTVIELSIPMESDIDECYICANSFCDAERCVRTMTHLECCTQAICCGCLVKLAKPCGCREDCREIIGFCPFCRDISPLSVRDMYFGYMQPCANCVDNDAPLIAPPIAAPAAPAAPAAGPTDGA